MWYIICSIASIVFGIVYSLFDPYEKVCVFLYSLVGELRITAGLVQCQEGSSLYGASLINYSHGCPIPHMWFQIPQP